MSFVPPAVAWDPDWWGHTVIRSFSGEKKQNKPKKKLPEVLCSLSANRDNWPAEYRTGQTGCLCSLGNAGGGVGWGGGKDTPWTGHQSFPAHTHHCGDHGQWEERRGLPPFLWWVIIWRFILIRRTNANLAPSDSSSQHGCWLEARWCFCAEPTVSLKTL